MQQITQAMLDKDAVRAAAQRAELGLMNVEEAVCGYINAMLASGKAQMAVVEIEDVNWIANGNLTPEQAEGFPGIIIRFE